MLKNILYAILSGLLLAASFPSQGFPLILFFAFVPLLLIEHGLTQSDKKRKGLRVFELSFITFFVWNAIGTWWLHYAQHPDGSYAWEAYIIPVIANALLMSTVFVTYYWVKKNTGNFYGITFLPVFWMTLEKLHLTWEFDWPWFNLGNAFASYHQWIQWYEYTGTFGGTLWVWIGNFIFFYGIVAFKNTKNKKYLYQMVFSCFFVIAIPIAISYQMYCSYKEKGKPIEVLMIQPNLDPYTEKYDKTSEQIVEQLITIVDKKITKNTSFIISPETAFPGSGPGVNINKINYDPAINTLKSWLKGYPKLTFISGLSMFQVYDSQEKATATASPINTTGLYSDSYNSTIQINNQDSLAFTHKSKLVPGVECFPYQKLFTPILGKAMLNFGGTIASLGTQAERTVYKNSYNNAKIAPNICYESIFGEYTSEFVKNGANVIFVASNDSWWGDSDAHIELLEYTKLRAIENRRDIARSANSGISCIINQSGDIVKSLAYDTQGALTGIVQLNEDKTFYSLYGDVIARFALFLTGILLAYTISTVVLTKIRS